MFSIYLMIRLNKLYIFFAFNIINIILRYKISISINAKNIKNREVF